MINSISNFNVPALTKNSSFDKGEILSTSKLNVDIYTPSDNKEIGVTTINFKNDKVDSTTTKFIESAFRTKYGSWDDDKISIYDINNYKELFPFELETGKVLSHGSIHNQGREMCYDLVVKTNSGPVRMQVQLGDHFKDTPMDENTFKNTVLKSFIMISESLKMDEEIGNKPQGGGSNSSKLEYDPATKTLDLKSLKESILASCDRQIAGNYDAEFRKKYKGHLNLDADPEHVKKVKSKYESIFDSILQLRIS